MASDLQDKLAQLPKLLNDNIESLHTYLMQFTAFEDLDAALKGIYEWVSVFCFVFYFS